MQSARGMNMAYERLRAGSLYDYDLDGVVSFFGDLSIEQQGQFMEDLYRADFGLLRTDGAVNVDPSRYEILLPWLNQ